MSGAKHAAGRRRGSESAEEMEREGLYVMKMNLRLLEKVEELTLYAIAQDKHSKKQEEIISLHQQALVKQRILNESLLVRLLQLEQKLSKK